MEAIANRDSMRVGELVRRHSESFTVKRTTVETIETHCGFGVFVSLVYAGDGAPNPDEPVGFDTVIARIDPEHCTFTNDGTFCVRAEPSLLVPVENFGDDENDYAASRFFENLNEAEEHVKTITRALKYAGLGAY
jgi:hypothetical protein